MGLSTVLICVNTERIWLVRVKILVCFGFATFTADKKLGLNWVCLALFFKVDNSDFLLLVIVFTIVIVIFGFLKIGFVWYILLIF